MKKVILFSAVALLALASCNKSYTCTYEHPLFEEDVVIEYNKVDESAASDGETACDNLGGDWATAE